MRCGSFLCGECTELLGEATYCAACVDFLRVHGRASRGLQLALVLGALSAVSLPLVLGLVGWLQGGSEPTVLLAVAYAFVLGLGLPVLHALALIVGLFVVARERRRPLRSSSALRWTRWTWRLALLGLGYFLLELAPLVWNQLTHRS